MNTNAQAVPSLSSGLAVKLVLATSAALKTLDTTVPPHDRAAQLALLAAPDLPARLRAAMLHESFGAAADTCGESWLLAAVVVLESRRLVHAPSDWRIAGEPPSAALLGAACTLCRLVPTLGHLESTVLRLAHAQGGSQGGSPGGSQGGPQ